ncbi:MAG: class I SAM-dependent methyltransferase [Lacunisphaera sp.]|nr:class I SAM-dependent methyltransferase [Lacunisphaera sp.]
MISSPANSFTWAGELNCKELVLHHGPTYLAGLEVGRILDFASGPSEEITQLAPGAREYHFLDSRFLPPSKPGYHLHRQSAGQPLPLPDNSLEVVTSNGSFDHFRPEERLAAFLEIERCLRPGGRFLFACEYFDYDSPDFFRQTQADPDMAGRNCQAYDNINLPAILARMTRLKILQQDLSVLPAGQPLRELIRPDQTRIYRVPSAHGLMVTWAAFFTVFQKT